MIAASKRALIIGGAIVLLAAFVWWWRTFGEVVGYGYLSWPEAGSCLIGDSTNCSLAKALCLGSHPRDFVAYWSSIFWSGVALLSVGALLDGRRSAVATPALKARRSGRRGPRP
jgi:hypothetical protein